MTSNELQRAIFEAIQRQAPNEKKLADELAQVLRRTKSGTYKRLNGEVPLSLDDICLLAERYHIPFEKILYPNSTKFLADFSGFSAKSSSSEYLDILENELTALRGAPHLKVWYVTVGLPDFYYFYFENLTVFQSYIWEKMVWGTPAWQRRNFRLDTPEREVLVKKAKRLANFYAHIEIVEIWNEYVLDTMLRQMLYVAESRLYDREEDLLTVCEEAGALIDHLEDMAFTEKHFMHKGAPLDNSASFRLCYNETMQNNIFILLENGVRKEAYTILNTPNFVKTADPIITDYMHDLALRLFNRAVPLGQNGEKHRTAYFGKLRNKLKFYTGIITDKMGQPV